MDTDLAIVSDDLAGVEPGTRVAKTKAEQNARAMEERIARVVEQARRPGYDATITVRQVEPAAPAAVDNVDCAGCGLPFLIGEGHWRDPSRHGLLVHSKGGCERARARAALREQPAAPTEDAASTPSTEKATMSARAVNAKEAGERNWQAILGVLRRDGETQQVGLIEQAGIPKGSIHAVLKRLADKGEIVMREELDARGAVSKFWSLASAISATVAAPAEPRAPADEPPAETPPEQPADELALQPDESDHSEAEDESEHPFELSAELAAIDMTVHEHLVVRYIGALITTIDRASILRAEAPPEHVFDRIERLLEIRDGAR